MANILKEDMKRRKFIESMNGQTKETDKNTRGAGETNIYNVKLRKTVNVSLDKTKLLENTEKESMVDENLHLHRDEKKENFKSKLSKFKFLEAGGKTDCKKEAGPLWYINFQNLQNIHLQKKKKIYKQK